MSANSLSAAGLQVIGESREASNSYPDYSNYPAASFTPVNSQPPIQFISPNDGLFASTDEHENVGESTAMAIPDAPVKKGKKGGPGKLKQGRSYSVGTVWQFHDEDDIIPQTDDAYGSVRPAKRRKSAPSQESKVLEAAAGESQEYFVEAHEAYNEEQIDLPASQLTTPPDSTKRSKKKGASAAAKNRKPKLPPFKALSVTKPVPPPNEHPAEDNLQSNAIIKLQAWTTTQEAMKTNGNGISQTTLDKLSVFRYKSSAEDYNTPFDGVQSGIIESTSIHDEEPPPSTDYDLPSSNFFRDEMWNEIATAEDLSPCQDDQDEIPCQPTVNPIPHLTTTPYEIGPAGTSIGTGSVPNGEAVITHSPPGQDLQPPNPLPNKNSLSYRLGDLHRCTKTQQLSFHGNDEEYLAYMDDNAERILIEDSEMLEDSNSCAGGGEIAAIDTSEMNLPQLPESGSGPHAKKGATAFNHFQVERSDIDDVEAPADAMATNCELDEFDEGLDDEDFITFATDTIVRETQPLISLKSKDDGTKDLMQPADSQPIGRAKQSQQVVQTTLGNAGHSKPPSSPVLDDGFPMNVDETNTLLLSSHAEANEEFEESESLIQAMQDEIENEEVYDSSLQFSPQKQTSNPSPTELVGKASANNPSEHSSRLSSSLGPGPLREAETWEFLRPGFNDIADDPFEDPPNHVAKQLPTPARTVENSFVQPNRPHMPTLLTMIDDTHEYEPLQRFVRYEFPQLMQDRCPVIGLSTQTVLRVCFRIGEMLREGTRCAAAGQDAIIELFARVSFSAREPGTTKQQFQFADLWSDKPPFAQGILANFRTTDLADTESMALIQGRKGQMVRCLGRLKREKRASTGWLLHIINIRETDWEEIRWTERIVSTGGSQSKPTDSESVTSSDW
ncbi:hypothetical protein B0J14DRAFT_579981 [Halenospora varia]|nr:hypothetical protein B0J14DRAFT_579981 [Halenospora varia]